MHELSLCLALLDQARALAEQHGAHGITRLLVRVGPLAGVEPALLASAWPLAAAETLAADALLDIETAPVVVHCRDCDRASTVAPNRLLCLHCGSHRTRLQSGDELLLVSLELRVPDASPG